MERRDSDIDVGIDALARALAGLDGPLLPTAPGPARSVLLPDGPDDDVALLLAQAGDSPATPRCACPWRTTSAPSREVRHQAADVLARWESGPTSARRRCCCCSELVTNALLHGRPPVELRLRRDRRHLTLEVHDSAPTLPPARPPSPDDEHGRGLLLVSLIAQRWGTRPTPDGKAVWCVLELPQELPANR